MRSESKAGPLWLEVVKCLWSAFAMSAQCVFFVLEIIFVFLVGFAAMVGGIVGHSRKGGHK